MHEADSSYGVRAVESKSSVRNLAHESDITGPNDAELTADQTRLSLALDAGQMGVWEWSISQGRVMWSSRIEQMHGLPVGSFEGTFEAYQRDIHPEDRDRVLSTIQRTLETRQRDYNLLYRIVRPDGTIRWLEAFGRLQLDERGEPERIVGICHDVTGRVESETLRAALAAELATRQEAEAARQRIQTILEGITDSFAVYDHDWRIVYANAAATQLLGLRSDEALGKVVWDVMPEAVDTSFYRELVRAMESQSTVSFTDHYAPLKRWFEVRVYPLGELGVAVYSRDVTVHKEQELLQERLRRYGELRAEVNAALARKGEPQEMLQACCDALVQYAEVICARLWLTDDALTTAELAASTGGLSGESVRLSIEGTWLERLVKEREPFLMAVDEPSSGALGVAVDPRAAAIVASPLRIGDSIVGGLTAQLTERPPADFVAQLATLSDAIALGIERRRAELELERRAQELSRSNADLEQFAYVASHDLQEPLRMVASYVQLLARRYKGKLDSDADDFINFTVEGATRMQRLINDLLTYSRVGTRRQAFTQVRTGDVLRTALSNLEKAIEESGTQVTQDPLPTLNGDAGQLVQLFQNLIGNAIKFRREGVPARVHISARAADSEWVFSVADNGIGIEPEYFERIFVIFQRLNTREHYPGTGIGLAIAKKIVERHGGRIWVDSALGEGATVYFAIPTDAARARSL